MQNKNKHKHKNTSVVKDFKGRKGMQKWTVSNNPGNSLTTSETPPVLFPRKPGLGLLAPDKELKPCPVNPGSGSRSLAPSPCGTATSASL